MYQIVQQASGTAPAKHKVNFKRIWQLFKVNLSNLYNIDFERL